MSFQPEVRLSMHRGVWAADWRDEHGKRHRNSLGTADQKEAEAALIDFKTDMARAATPELVTVGHVVERYLAEHVVVSTGNMRRAWEKHVKAHFAHLRPDQVSDQLCKDYGKTRFTPDVLRGDGSIAKRGGVPIKPETLIKELGVMRNAFGWAKGVAELKASVADARVWTPAPGKPRDIRLSREQAALIFGRKIKKHLRLFLLLALGTAARLGALLELPWSQVDLENRIIDFSPAADDPFAERRKGRAVVPINDMLFAALTEAKAVATTPFVIEYAGRRVLSTKQGVRRLSIELGIKFSPHVLRHTAATWMAEAGVELAVIGQMLGHKSINTTYRIYARFTPKYKATAAQALNVLQVAA